MPAPRLSSFQNQIASLRMREHDAIELPSAPFDAIAPMQGLSNYLPTVGAIVLGAAIALGVVASGVGTPVLVAMLVALIGGRIVPSFTRNWLMQMKSPALPAPIDRLDHFGLALTVAGMAAWVVAPDHVASGSLLVAAGLSTLVRLGRWRGARTGAEALVWILHVGIAWLGVGKILLGLSVLTPAAPVSMATHALTAGAIGVMTLAVMTRATLGHTGRERTAGAATLAIYVLVNLAAAVRVAAGLIPEHQIVLLGASGLLWAGAYGGFALAYGPLLIGPKR